MKSNSTFVFFVNRFDPNSIRVKNEKMVDKMEVPEPQKMKAAPSERSINNILNFARSYDAVETKHTGYVEMILN